MWQALGAEEKKKWEEKSKQDKERFKRENDAYQKVMASAGPRRVGRGGGGCYGLGGGWWLASRCLLGWTLGAEALDRVGTERDARRLTPRRRSIPWVAIGKQAPHVPMAPHMRTVRSGPDRAYRREVAGAWQRAGLVSAATDEMRGAAATDEMRGAAATDVMRGAEATDEMRGAAATD
jgi:hypothetical protein